MYKKVFGLLVISPAGYTTTHDPLANGSAARMSNSSGPLKSTYAALESKDPMIFNSGFEKFRQECANSHAKEDVPFITSLIPAAHHDHKIRPGRQIV